VAAGEEVADPIGRPAAVRGDDGVGIEVVGRPIDEHERSPRAPIGDEVALVGRCRRHDEPVDATGDELADKSPFALRVLVDAARDHRNAPRPGRILDGPGDRGGPGVGQVLEDEPDSCGLAVAPAEAARRQVGLVVELFDGALDAGEEIGRDGRLGVDHPRHGLQADPGQRGDIAHRRPRPVAPAVPVRIIW
jgi:hypothetical protein